MVHTRNAPHLYNKSTIAFFLATYFSFGPDSLIRDTTRGHMQGGGCWYRKITGLAAALGLSVDTTRPVGSGSQLCGVLSLLGRLKSLLLLVRLFRG